VEPLRDSRVGGTRGSQHDAATASSVAALLGTIAASGGFERKWRANRISRGRIEELQIDLTDDSADAKSVRERLKSIMAAEDEAIVGNGK
jgi:hypothetical protein